MNLTVFPILLSIFHMYLIHPHPLNKKNITVSPIPNGTRFR